MSSLILRLIRRPVPAMIGISGLFLLVLAFLPGCAIAPTPTPEVLWPVDAVRYEFPLGAEVTFTQTVSPTLGDWPDEFTVKFATETVNSRTFDILRYQCGDLKSHDIPQVGTSDVILGQAIWWSQEQPGVIVIWAIPLFKPE